MQRVSTRAELREALRARADGAVVGLVPTMGYLHEGHLSLVDAARAAAADVVVMSIYVNPLQFGAGEDLTRYPRDLERDVALAQARSVDLLFTPDDAEMYPAGEALVRISPGPLADGLCGAFRPGHFEGVLTVVAKLFNIVRPELATFGQKDYQQAALVRRMVDDLSFGVRIEVGPIVREADGLAMSSRNAYLRPDERARASALHRGLSRAAEDYREGERSVEALLRRVRETLAAEGGIVAQYVEAVHPETLRAVERAESGTVLALAAFVGRTRLIDNLILP